MKVGEVYINIYNGYSVIIEKTIFNHIFYRYLAGRGTSDFLINDKFDKYFKFSEELTVENMIREIIE